MYTRTPNYMWMQTLVTTVPIVTHRNEWGLRSGVSTHETGTKRNTSSTKTHQIYIWRACELWDEQRKSQHERARALAREKVGNETKKSESGHTKDSPMHEIRWNVTRSYLPNDFHSFTPKRFPKSIPQEKFVHIVQWQKNYIYLYFWYVFFRRRCCCCPCCHCRFPVISRNETEHFNCGSIATRVQPYFHVLCGVCCAKHFFSSAWERKSLSNSCIVVHRSGSTTKIGQW